MRAYTSIQVSARRLALFIALAVTVAIGAGTTIKAQDTETFSQLDGIAPPNLAPGTPAGSYALSGFDTVNLYNGSSNFPFPLLTVGGRGEAGYQMTLPIQSQWHILSTLSCDPYPSNCYENNTAELADLNYFFPSWSNFYTPGYVTYQYSPLAYDGCTDPTTGLPSYDFGARQTLTRLTFVSPDGTQHELRDDRYDGKPLAQNEDNCLNNPAGDGNHSPVNNRGVNFSARDGSAIKFVSDQDVLDPYESTASVGFDPTGFLYFPNGTAYRVYCGAVTYIRDRNGNEININYELTRPYDTTTGHCGFDPVYGTATFASLGRPTSITDSVGRTITITHGAPLYFEASSGTTFPAPPYDDVISFQGFQNAKRTITVHWDYMANALREDFTQPTQSNPLFPELDDTFWNINPLLVTKVTIPNGEAYQFQYNIYGELARVTLPTKGKYEYDWGSGYTNSTQDDGVNIVPYISANIYRRLLTRRVYSGPNQLQGSETYSASSTPGPNRNYGGTTTVTVTHLDPNSNVLASEVHSFYGDASATVMPYSNLTGDGAYPSVRMYTPWNEGFEYGTNMSGLRSVANTQVQGGTTSWWAANCQLTVFDVGPPATPCSLDTEPLENPQLTEVDTSLLDAPTTQISSVVNSYDQYNNVTDSTEYDYGLTPASGAVLKHTHVDYVWASNPAYVSGSIYLPRLPLDENISVGSTMYSQSSYEYDCYQPGGCSGTSDTRHAALVPRPSITQLDASYASGAVTQRGNVTMRTEGLGLDVAVGSHEFDVAGNVVQKMDALLNPTTVSYSDPSAALPAPVITNTFAFATTITNALGQTIQMAWDVDIGKPVAIVDPNNYAKTAAFNDNLDRLTSVINPDGGTTSYTYLDSANTVTTTSAVTLSTDANCVPGTQQTDDLVYDGLGQKYQQIHHDSAGLATTTTLYDGMGRVYSVSNPVYTGVAPVTATLYDGLNRPLSVTAADGSASSYNYAGNQTTETAPNYPSASVTVSTFDAVGRLTSIIDAIGNTTSYTYDPLNDLLTVSQGVQNRSFTYDSLRRLRSAVNPENGTTKYTYYPTGSQWTTTDNAGVVTTFTYDQLNREHTKSYSDGVTPSVTNKYDSPFIGAISSISNTVASETFDSYDPVGRVTQTTQNIVGSGVPLTWNYTYDVAGNVEVEKYPSGRKVQTCHSDLGEASDVSDVTNSTPKPYINGIQYAPQRQRSLWTLGNNLTAQQCFNSRLQPSAFRLGTGATDAACTGSPSDIWQLAVAYQPAAASKPTNNGNVWSQTTTAQQSSGTFTASQVYTYDPLNRLTSVAEGNTTWSQGFSYDQFGNRALTSWNPASFLSPSTQVALDQFDPLTNRILKTPSEGALPADAYDKNGNLTDDPLLGQMQYDAENRMTQFTSNGVTASFQYDGSGRRVTKMTGGVTTFYVYDATGQLGAEYGASSASDCTTCYLTTDWLGSTRVITDTTGAIAGQHDYAPFGEELLGSLGREAVINYSGSDGVRQKFTGKERDSESGLDYFGARYYGGGLGRLTTPDTFWKDSHVSDPQSWNKYAYARNNPLRYVDPHGENVTVTTKCSTNSYGTTSCNVSISASIAIYGVKGSGVVADQLEEAAAEIKASIESTWTGNFQQDNVTYTVATHVDVTIADSQEAASATGAQNVVGLVNGIYSATADSMVEPATHSHPFQLNTSLRLQDTGVWNFNSLGPGFNVAAHEFIHFLGVWDRYSGSDVANTNSPWPIPAHATSNDYKWGLQEAVQGVNGWLASPGNAPNDRFVSPRPSTYSDTTNIRAPILGWWK